MNYTLGRVGIVAKDEYNPSTAYAALDLVTYQGSSYIAKIGTTGNLPTNTTYWTLVSQRGKTAYESAQSGGYTDLEPKFESDLKTVSTKQSALSNSNKLAIDSGGTNASDAASARTQLGITLANLGAAAASHNHDAGNINSGRLGLARIPTSGTANRVLLVGGTANADPAYGQVALTSMVTGTLPIGNGGTNATDKKAAKTNLGISYNNTAGATPTGGADGDIVLVRL